MFAGRTDVLWLARRISSSWLSSLYRGFRIVCPNATGSKRQCDLDMVLIVGVSFVHRRGFAVDVFDCLCRGDIGMEVPIALRDRRRNSALQFIRPQREARFRSLSEPAESQPGLDFDGENKEVRFVYCCFGFMTEWRYYLIVTRIPPGWSPMCDPTVENLATLQGMDTHTH